MDGFGIDGLDGALVCWEPRVSLFEGEGVCVKERVCAFWCMGWLFLMEGQDVVVSGAISLAALQERVA